MIFKVLKVSLAVMTLMILKVSAETTHIQSDPCFYLSQYKTPVNIKYESEKSPENRADDSANSMQIIPEKIKIPLSVELKRLVENSNVLKKMDAKTDIGLMVFNLETGVARINGVNVSSVLKDHCQSIEDPLKSKKPDTSSIELNADIP